MHTFNDIIIIIMKDKMKFKLIFNRKTYIIAIFAMLLAFFTIIINIIKAASLDNPNTSQMIVYASSSLICTAIIWLSVYSVLFSKFVILENSLILCLSVFREDIPYEKISLIRENSEDKMMLYTI